MAASQALSFTTLSFDCKAIKINSFVTSSWTKNIISSPIWLSGKRKCFLFGFWKNSRISVGDWALKPRWSELPAFQDTGQHRILWSASCVSKTRVTFLEPKDGCLHRKMLPKAVDLPPKFSMTTNKAISSNMTLSGWSITGSVERVCHPLLLVI